MNDVTRQSGLCCVVLTRPHSLSLFFFCYSLLRGQTSFGRLSAPGAGYHGHHRIPAYKLCARKASDAGADLQEDERDFEHETRCQGGIS